MLLTLYFATSIASQIYRGDQHYRSLNTALFHTLGVSTLIVFCVTWLFLWLLLRETQEAQIWRQLLFCYTSYAQHGGNYALIVIDGAMNGLELKKELAVGWSTLYMVIFSLWTSIYYVLSGGKFLYPFLDPANGVAYYFPPLSLVTIWAYYFVFASNVRLFRWIRKIVRKEKTD